MTSTTCDAGALARVLCVGDSALILSQRLCEWVAAAHSVEEDIAQANIGLDLLGQARAWLSLAGQMEGSGRSEDDFAYWREAAEFNNFVLVELESADFAECVMRQFLFDSWHTLALQKLAADAHPKIAEIAAKAQKEAAYHLRHSSAWMERLGDGTADSHCRLRAARDTFWRWCGQFFDGRILAAQAQQQWLEMVGAVFARAQLEVPDTEGFVQHCSHSEALSRLLAEMQCLHRAHPGMQW